MLVPSWLRGPFPLIVWVTTFALGLSLLLRPQFFHDWIRNRNPEFRSLPSELGYRNVRLLGLLFLLAAIFFCAVWVHNVRSS
jgi:hypothetical protein